MAVLIEGISVVVRCRSVVEKFAGGAANFKRSIPNGTLRSDGELACVTFMTPSDARVYIERLCGVGLVHRGDDGRAVDLVVVDQNQGPVTLCEWLDFGHADWDGDPTQVVAVCCARPTKSSAIVVPEGWVYSSSLTANHRFVEGGSIPPNLSVARSENGIDVLVDKDSGREYFVRRY